MIDRLGNRNMIPTFSYEAWKLVIRMSWRYLQKSSKQKKHSEVLFLGLIIDCLLAFMDIIKRGMTLHLYYWNGRSFLHSHRVTLKQLPPNWCDMPLLLIHKCSILLDTVSFILESKRTIFNIVFEVKICFMLFDLFVDTFDTISGKFRENKEI